MRAELNKQVLMADWRGRLTNWTTFLSDLLNPMVHQRSIHKEREDNRNRWERTILLLVMEVVDEFPMAKVADDQERKPLEMEVAADKGDNFELPITKKIEELLQDSIGPNKPFEGVKVYRCPIFLDATKADAAIEKAKAAIEKCGQGVHLTLVVCNWADSAKVPTLNQIDQAIRLLSIERGRVFGVVEDEHARKEDKWKCLFEKIREESSQDVEERSYKNRVLVMPEMEDEVCKCDFFYFIVKGSK